MRGVFRGKEFGDVLALFVENDGFVEGMSYDVPRSLSLRD